MKQKMFSEELNIKSTTPGRYKWLFGAFGFWQGIDNTVTLDYFTKDYATRKLYDTPTYGVAFYHQSTIDDLLTRGLSLTFGIRYDYEHTSNDFLFYKETGRRQQADGCLRQPAQIQPGHPENRPAIYVPVYRHALRHRDEGV